MAAFITGYDSWPTLRSTEDSDGCQPVAVNGAGCEVGLVSWWRRWLLPGLDSMGEHIQGFTGI